MLNITYVFVGNRKERYLTNNYESKDFLYGLDYFDKNEFNLQIIEGKLLKFPLRKVLYFFDICFQKILSLPVNTFLFLNFNNFKTLLKTDKLILVNETTLCSIFPVLVFAKIFKNIDVYLFSMGLYSKNIRFPFFKKLHFFFIRLFLFFIKEVFFLGEGEFNKALNIHPQYYNKFKFSPFSIDTDFWVPDDTINIESRKNILFVGNDGNRDTKLFLDIVNICKEFQFTAVTSLPEILNSDLKNLNVIKGSLNSMELTDYEIRKLYIKSKFIILPLKETTQPSGQSVSLQAMSCKRPVLISKTEGLWDKNNLVNNENIFLIETRNPEEWKKKIVELIKNEDLLQKVENQARELVLNKYTLITFTERLLKSIN